MWKPSRAWIFSKAWALLQSDGCRGPMAEWFGKCWWGVISKLTAWGIAWGAFGAITSLECWRSVSCQCSSRGAKALIFTTKPTQSSRSEEQTSELQSLMRISYAVFCLQKKNDVQSTEYKSIEYNAR